MFINMPNTILPEAQAHGTFFPGPYSSDSTGGGLGPMKGGKRKMRSRSNRIKRKSRRVVKRRRSDRK